MSTYALRIIATAGFDSGLCDEGFWTSGGPGLFFGPNTHYAWKYAFPSTTEGVPKKNAEGLFVGPYPDGADLYKCVFELAVKPHCLRKCSKWKKLPKDQIAGNYVIRGLLVHHWRGSRDPAHLRNKQQFICMSNGIEWRRPQNNKN